MVVRDEVRLLHALGPLPAEDDDSVDDARFEDVDRLFRAIERPVTEDEARLLLECFGPDNCFGLSWALMHLIESSPVHPVTVEPPPGSNLWVETLWLRHRNGLERRKS
ncbi:hypothetical protein GCM10022243_02680 [Saccharothrix violaceirubra]|uniref:Uncharacterized protein n=1 Tax=Saccharothrix violaceirubra TaxID=413306 RepID=A0A7W7T4T6_9PSEU|nr:hypothetical protein [Saccharothrix violaceirubra]MBB4966027.1 hypothetical protein [Saccharothrix violaceirubra]